jgi:hypothetical protein
MLVDNFSGFTKMFSHYLGLGVNKIKTEFFNAWEDAKITENFTKMTTIVQGSIEWLGVKITSGIYDVLSDLDSYFADTFKGVRDYIKKQDKRNPWMMAPDKNGEFPEGSLAPFMAPAPKNRTRQQDKPRSIKQLLPVTSKPNIISPVNDRGRSLTPVNTSTVLNPVSSPSTVVPLSPEGAKIKIQGIEDTVDSYQTSSVGVVPPYLQTVYSDGLDVFGGIGAEMVSVFAAGTAGVVGAAKTGMEGTAAVLSDGLTTSLSEANKDFADSVLKKIPAMMKAQMSKIFDPEGLSALKDVIGGTATTGNLSDLFPDSPGGSTGYTGTGGTTDSENAPGVAIPGVGANALPSIADAKGPGKRGTRLDPVMKRLGLDKKLEEKMATRQSSLQQLPNSAASTMYDGILTAETGSAGSGTDPKRFIRTRVTPARNRGRPSSAYGPSQMTKTYLQDFKKNEWDNLNPQEQEYLDGLIDQGKKMLSIGKSNPSDPIYGYGGKGTMGDTPEQRDLYKSVAQKSMVSLAKHSRSYQDFISSYRGEHDGRYFSKIARELGKKGLTPEQIFAEMQSMDVANAGSVGDPTSTKIPEAAYQNAPGAGEVPSLIKKFADTPGLDPYAGIPATDSMGEDQRAKFKDWNSNPFANNDKLLSTVDPSLQAVIKNAQQKSGIPFVMGSGYRNDEDQAKARKFGWSKAEHSDHEDKKAADLWGFDKKTGQITFDPSNQAGIAAAMKASAAELGLDLDVGADWKNPDKPHFALKGDKRLDQKMIDQILNPDAGAVTSTGQADAPTGTLSKFARMARRRPGESRAGASSSVSTGVSSNRYGSFGAPNADAEAFRTRAGMKEKLGEYGLADKLLGESAMQGLDTPVKSPSISQEGQTPIITPKPQPTAIPQQQGKPPMQQNKSTGDVNTQQASMPSIETIPSLDELKMLSVNSEALS